MSGALVLIVDDNENNRDILSRRLRRQKYTVDVAENGQQALDMVERQKFDRSNQKQPIQHRKVPVLIVS